MRHLATKYEGITSKDANALFFVLRSEFLNNIQEEVNGNQLKYLPRLLVQLENGQSEFRYFRSLKRINILYQYFEDIKLFSFIIIYKFIS